MAFPPSAGRFWKAADASLQSRGGQLISLGIARREGDPAFLGVSGVFATVASLGRSWAERAPLADPIDPALLEQCVAFDRAFWGDEPYLGSLVERGARAARWLVESAIDRFEPRACAIINGDSSAGMIAERVCRERGVDVVFWERGAFAGTIVFDRIGVEGRGPCALSMDPEWRARLAAAPTEEELAAASRLREWLLATRRENWSSAACPAELSSDSIVCFTGLEPSARPSDRSARWFTTPLDAARALVEAVGDRALLKPHPNDPERRRYAALAESASAAFTESVSVYDAAAAGAIVATTSASVAWMAAALGARVLTLRPVPLCVSGATYEASPSLDAALRAADEGEDLERRERQGMAACARYLRGYCFSAEAEMQALGARGVDEAVAEFLPSGGGAGDLDGWLDELVRAGVAV